jgi:hypothetical protein
LMVYELYGLSEEEIGVVEGGWWIVMINLYIFTIGKYET